MCLVSVFPSSLTLHPFAQREPECNNEYVLLHLNLLQFKYLITINFLLCSCITNIIDMPMCSVAYVQKGYAVSNLVDIWY